MQTVLLFSNTSNDEDAEDLLDWFREEACTSNDMLQSDSDSGCVSCIVSLCQSLCSLPQQPAQQVEPWHFVALSTGPA